MNKRILVLSPHLDDAVLSCADHILEWKKQGYEINIVTIFTSFKSSQVSPFAKHYLESSGFSDVISFEKARKKEDINAMTALGVEWKHLNFIDGAFRTVGTKQLYTQTKLFSGQLNPSDLLLIPKLKKEFKNFEFEFVLITLGIGRHVDHVLTKLFADKYFINLRKWYYVDWPYAQKWRNWSLPQIIEFLSHKKSFRLMSRTKLDLLRLYTSQFPLLFQKNPSFPEIILYER